MKIRVVFNRANIRAFTFVGLVALGCPQLAHTEPPKRDSVEKKEKKPEDERSRKREKDSKETRRTPPVRGKQAHEDESDKKRADQQSNKRIPKKAEKESADKTRDDKPTNKREKGRTPKPEDKRTQLQEGLKERPSQSGRTTAKSREKPATPPEDTTAENELKPAEDSPDNEAATEKPPTDPLPKKRKASEKKIADRGDGEEVDPKDRERADAERSVPRRTPGRRSARDEEVAEAPRDDSERARTNRPNDDAPREDEVPAAPALTAEEEAARKGSEEEVSVRKVEAQLEQDVEKKKLALDKPEEAKSLINEILGPDSAVSVAEKRRTRHRELRDSRRDGARREAVEADRQEHRGDRFAEPERREAVDYLVRRLRGEPVAEPEVLRRGWTAERERDLRWTPITDRKAANLSYACAVSG